MTCCHERRERIRSFFNIKHLSDSDNQLNGNLSIYLAPAMGKGVSQVPAAPHLPPQLHVVGGRPQGRQAIGCGVYLMVVSSLLPSDQIGEWLSSDGQKEGGGHGVRALST